MRIKDALKRLSSKKIDVNSASHKFYVLAFISFFGCLQALFNANSEWTSFVMYPELYPFDLWFTWLFLMQGLVFCIVGGYCCLKARKTPKEAIFPTFAVLAIFCFILFATILGAGYINWSFFGYNYLFWMYSLWGAVLFILVVYFWRKARKTPTPVLEKPASS